METDLHQGNGDVFVEFGAQAKAVGRVVGRREIEVSDILDLVGWRVRRVVEFLEDGGGVGVADCPLQGERGPLCEGGGGEEGGEEG